MSTGLAIEHSFELPGGVTVGEDSRLGKAVLRSLTGREEEWLARNRDAPSAARTTWLLLNCLCSLDDTPITVDLVRKLLVGDRDYLMLQLRRLTLGDNVHAIVSCPACNSKIDVDFRTTEIPVTARPQTKPWYALALSGRTVRFRLPTGGDQELVLGMDSEAAVEELLRHCILDDGGSAILPEERDAIIEAIEQLAPLVDLELDLACPDCGHRFLQPFDTTTYFLEEVGADRRQLLREVHTLALYYHWSETEILGLQRDRRHAYLGLLDESLQPE